MSSGITRKKGQSGRAKVVQCIQCGKMLPRDKAVEKRKSSLRLDYKLRKLLKKVVPISAAERASFIIVCPALNTENMYKIKTKWVYLNHTQPTSSNKILLVELENLLLLRRFI